MYDDLSGYVLVAVQDGAEDRALDSSNETSKLCSGASARRQSLLNRKPPYYLIIEDPTNLLHLGPPVSESLSLALGAIPGQASREVQYITQMQPDSYG